METRVSVVATCVILCWQLTAYVCEWVPTCINSDRGLTAEWQRTVSDVAESGRLVWWGFPEDNLATSTMDGLRSETLKAYIRDTKTAAVFHRLLISLLKTAEDRTRD